MERPLKIGFIGCGEVGAEKHLPAVREVPELEVVAVADSDPDRIRAMETRFGIRRSYPDATALLADREVDVVAVCLPPRLQVPAAHEALDANKHVWVEAPIGLSLPECDRLIAKARSSDRRVTVGFHMRWHRLVRQAKTIVESGRLGEIQTIRATWNSPRADDTLPEWRRHRALLPLSPGRREIPREGTPGAIGQEPRRTVAGSGREARERVAHRDPNR